MDKYILTLDQGTTSSRAIVFDKKGKTIAMSRVTFTLDYPKPGWVECDAIKLWETQQKAMEEVLKIIPANQIEAIGITNQRETTIIWEKETGKPLHPAIIWQCRRTAKICDNLKSQGLEEYIKENTGLVIDAYFSAGKIKWILDNYPEIKAMADSGKVCFGTVDTWILWNLTRGKVHATDYTNASRTMIFNIKSHRWDDYLTGKLGIPEEILPEVKDTSGIFGYFERDGIKIPITSMVGDQQAALFGQTCFSPGEIKNTYGTGCFILCNTGENPVRSENGLLTTIAWKYNNRTIYALEGSVFNAGSAIQWLRDEMKIISKASECDELAESTADNAGVFFVPAFTGLGAPHWDMYARGVLIGITRGTGRGHLARAVLESIAYQSDDVLEAMRKDSKIKFKSIYADGGASASKILMQFQSDISGLPVLCPFEKESTALGAAYLAGIATGYWKDSEELKKIHEIKETYNPGLPPEKVAKYKKYWQNAVLCSKMKVSE